MVAAKENKATPSDVDARSRLLEAGVALFAENGYASTSVRQITEEAGVTKPVLYYYFGSKDGLFQAIIDEVTRREREVLGRAENQEGSTYERLAGLFRSVIDLVDENRTLVQMIHGVVFGPRRGMPDCGFDDVEAVFFESVKRIYAEGVRRGECVDVDPELAAHAVASLLDHSINMELAHPEMSDPERAVKLLSLVFTGLAAKDRLP